MDKQSRPSNIELQLKEVNEEIYSRQGGQMSHARGKDGSLKKVNNLLLKSMVPLMRVADNLYLADTTDKPAPSMKAVFDQCITSLTLLCEANLEVETQRREAFKPTTPTLYKSLVTKPRESRTLLFGDNMEEQMKALENKDKLQKSLAQEKATGSKKQWSTSSSTFPRYVPYEKATGSKKQWSTSTSTFPRYVPYEKATGSKKQWSNSSSTFPRYVPYEKPGTSNQRRAPKDLFASRLNRQVDTFVSWKPEPEAWAVDAFSLNCKDIMFYALPPFSVLGQVLNKIIEDQASGILLMPLWPTQPWFPVMLSLLMDHPRHIMPDSRNLQLRGKPLALHQLHKRLHLLVIHLSGQPSQIGVYHNKLKNSFLIPGEKALKSSMTQLYAGGEHIVANGKLIPLLPL